MRNLSFVDKLWNQGCSFWKRKITTHLMQVFKMLKVTVIENSIKTLPTARGSLSLGIKKVIGKKIIYMARKNIFLQLTDMIQIVLPSAVVLNIYEKKEFQDKGKRPRECDQMGQITSFPFFSITILCSTISFFIYLNTQYIFYLLLNAVILLGALSLYRITLSYKYTLSDLLKLKMTARLEDLVILVLM